eukprot:jgi/Ulvmu1/9479/UM052_0048.1
MYSHRVSVPGGRHCLPLGRLGKAHYVHTRSLVSRVLTETASSPRSDTDISDVRVYIDQICQLGGPQTSVDGCALAESLGTSTTDGLQSANVAGNRSKYGSNALPEVKQVSFIELMAEAAEDFTLLILLGSGFVSLALWAVVDKAQGPGWIDSTAILAAVAVVVLVTATTNYQRDKQFSKLSKAEGNITVRVRRDGDVTSIPVAELVTGDLLIFEAGDILQADGVLIDGFDIRVDESNLTGESEDVTKCPRQGPNILYSGSQVMSGYGTMLVAAVGPRSQAGKIMLMARGQQIQSGSSGSESDSSDPAQADEPSTSVLQDKLEDLANAIGRFGAAAAAATFAIQLTSLALSASPPGSLALDLATLRAVNEYVINAITVLVVAVPEGLPLAVTMALAFSVRCMLDENNLVRYLNACETMATCTSICSDKTGTLTLNRLRVVRGRIAGTPSQVLPDVPTEALLATRPYAPLQRALDRIDPAVLRTLCDAVVLNSTATLDAADDGEAVVDNGNRTETALLRFAAGLGVNAAAERTAVDVVAAMPFSSERKRMATVVRRRAGEVAAAAAQAGDGTGGEGERAGALRIYVKGAAELVLERCTHQVCADGTIAAMPEADKAAMLREMQAGGLRILAVAFRNLPHADLAALDACSNGDTAAAAAAVAARGDVPANAEEGLILLALFGIADRVRPEVPDAVGACQQAGVRVRMLTGDNKVTAATIAMECGIIERGACLCLSAELRTLCL